MIKAILHKIFFQPKIDKLTNIPKNSKDVWVAGIWGSKFKSDPTWAETIGKEKISFLSGVGWNTPRPKKGDRIVIEMQSGQHAAFKVLDIEYAHDPTDMFFLIRAVFSEYVEKENITKNMFI